MPHDRSGTLVYTDKRVSLSLCHSRASFSCCLDGHIQLSVITNLRNPTLKPRHWEEIEAVLETEFTPEEPLTLGRLVDIDAFHFAEDLEEISGKASSEAGLETILKKVCVTITQWWIRDLVVGGLYSPLPLLSYPSLPSLFLRVWSQNAFRAC